jgi:hypothetical protein
MTPEEREKVVEILIGRFNEKYKDVSRMKYAERITKIRMNQISDYTDEELLVQLLGVDDV